MIYVRDKIRIKPGCTPASLDTILQNMPLVMLCVLTTHRCAVLLFTLKKYYFVCILNPECTKVQKRRAQFLEDLHNEFEIVQFSPWFYTKIRIKPGCTPASLAQYYLAKNAIGAVMLCVLPAVLLFTLKKYYFVCILNPKCTKVQRRRAQFLEELHNKFEIVQFSFCPLQ